MKYTRYTIIWIFLCGSAVWAAEKKISHSQVLKTALTRYLGDVQKLVQECGDVTPLCTVVEYYTCKAIDQDSAIDEKTLLEGVHALLCLQTRGDIEVLKTHAVSCQTEGLSWFLKALNPDIHSFVCEAKHIKAVAGQYFLLSEFYKTWTSKT